VSRVLVAVVVAAAVAALVAGWPEVRGDLSAADPGLLALASLCAVGNILAAAAAWRAALAALGSPVSARPAVAIFCVGQLGKYLPGSVWPLVVQAQLTSRRGVPAAHVVLAGALALTEAVVVSLAVGLLAVPALVEATGVPGDSRMVVVVVVTVVIAAVAAGLVVGLSPRLVGAGIRGVLRVTRRPPLEAPVTRMGLGSVLAWAALSVALLGGHAAALAAAVGLSWSVAVATASAYAVAEVTGLLAVPMPAGLGIREGVLVAVLAPVASVPAALAVAVLSRLVRTAADLGTAGLARAALGRARLGWASKPLKAPAVVPTRPRE
jgi:uncharacterized membrane protein YbhN (UPF0104 family)